MGKNLELDWLDDKIYLRIEYLSRLQMPILWYISVDFFLNVCDLLTFLFYYSFYYPFGSYSAILRNLKKFEIF